MFDHVVFGVRDYEASKQFYLKTLAPIGIVILAEDKLGIEMSSDGKSSLCIRREPDDPQICKFGKIRYQRQSIVITINHHIITLNCTTPLPLNPLHPNLQSCHHDCYSDSG